MENGWSDNFFKTLTGFYTIFNSFRDFYWKFYQNEGLNVTFRKNDDNVKLKVFCKNCFFLYYIV